MEKFFYQIYKSQNIICSDLILNFFIFFIYIHLAESYFTITLKSTGIARNILNATDNLNELHPRTMDHNLVRFKLLMGMLVWSHQAVGVKYHRQLDGIKGKI